MAYKCTTMMKKIILVTIALSLLLLRPANGIEYDFCVADYSRPHGPNGYACKDPANVTAADFVYTGFRTPANTKPFKVGLTLAFSEYFPGLNGLDVSMLRADIEVGGAGFVHTHRAAELLVVAEGSIGVGYFDSNNVPYYKVLEKDDMIAIPATLPHFLINAGNVSTVSFSSFNTANPGVLHIPFAWFGNELPTQILEKVTLLDGAQIKKLKQVIGGTN